MDDAPSFERLRQPALAMLRDGNSAEAVAQVLEVPLEAVRAWAGQPAPAPAPADRPPATPSRRFDIALVQAPSDGFRLTGLAVAVVLASVGLHFSFQSFRDAHGRVDFLVDGVMFLVVPGIVARMGLGWFRATLVLGRDEIVAPRALLADRMAYEDVAGYTLVPHTLVPSAGVTFPGRLLSIQSRRPGVPALTVFLHEKYPVDRRILARLDTVARANAAAPPPGGAVHRPPRDSGIPGALPLAGIAGIAVLCAIGFLPRVHDNVDASTGAHPPPPRSELRRAEGTVVSAEPCVSVGRANAKRSRMRVGVTQRGSSTQVDIPCLFPPALLIENGPHQLTVDVDPRSDPPDKVYQVTLDGRRVLDYDTVASPAPRPGRGVSATLLCVALATIGLLVVAAGVAWRRLNRRATAD